MQLHPSVDPCMVCAPFVPSSITVHHQPFEKMTYIQNSFSSCNFPALHHQIIFKIYFFHLLVRTILTNISKSNFNYINLHVHVYCNCMWGRYLHKSTISLLIQLHINIHYPHTIFLPYISTTNFSRSNFFRLLVSSNRHLSH